MKSKDYIVWFVVLLLIFGGYFFLKKTKTSQNKEIAYPTPSSIEKKITEKFGGIVIPTDADRSDLSPVNGKDGFGMATRRYSNGKFSLTVLGDLPEPKSGQFYQAWILGNNGMPINVGKLSVAKGGYLVDFTTTGDYSNYSKVFVTLESKFDSNPEEHVLEGSF